MGGGGTDGARAGPVGGSPWDGGPWPRGGDWWGNGELMVAAGAAGVPRRDTGLAKPSGRSFQAGRLVAVVYVVTVLAGDWLIARGGGGTPVAAGCPPNWVGGV